jgi:hypothetical protein
MRSTIGRRRQSLFAKIMTLWSIRMTIKTTEA